MQKRRSVWTCAQCLIQYTTGKGKTIPSLDAKGAPMLRPNGAQKRTTNRPICDQPQWGCGGKVFIYFPSEGEAQRYAHLRLQESGGIIAGLKTGTRFPLHVLTPTGTVVEIGAYKCDFDYTRNGERVIEDYKGGLEDAAATNLFHHKRAHVEAEYQIKVRIVSGKPRGSSNDRTNRRRA